MDDDSDLCRSEEEDFWVPAPKRSRSYRSYLVISSDEEEVETKKSKSTFLKEVPGKDAETSAAHADDAHSDDGSDATEVVSRLSCEREDLAQSGGRGGEEDNDRFLIDSEEAELLSLSSDGDDMGVDRRNDLDNCDEFDDDDFKPAPSPPKPRPSSTCNIEENQPQPGTSRSFLVRESICSSEDIPTRPASATTVGPSWSSSDEDRTFDPAGDTGSETDFTDFSDGDNDDFKMPPKARRPLSQLNSQSTRSNFNVYSDSEDENEDDVVPTTKHNLSKKTETKWKEETPSWRNHPDPEQWYNEERSDSPPVYDPSKARSTDWHGDVRRTVSMLNETLKEMPMPNDEDSEDIKLPPGLVELYAHQSYALRWMMWRENQFPGGGILADEMGLGKTIEVIALIKKHAWDTSKAGRWMVSSDEAKEHGCIPSRTTLIVAPLGCIPQWIREIETKGKNLKVFKYHGSNKDTKKIFATDLAKYDIVITTYQTIACEIPKIDSVAPPRRRYRSPLQRIYWVRVVLDEAHQIRNPKTKAAQAIYQVEARHRWAVTGTPIHNRPEDFYSMCAFLRLQPFDERPVWDLWIGLKTIKRGAEERLHILGKALILRRTKDEVGSSGDKKVREIPPKTVEVIDIELNEEERRIYDMLMEYAQGVLRKFLSQKEQRKHGVQLGGLMYAADRVQERREQLPDDIKFSHIFALLTRLRQCAVLPHLIETMIQAEDIDDGEEFDDLRPEHIISKRNPVFNRTYKSSKFQRILEDVDEIRARANANQPMDKIIIVSSWTTTLDIIYEHLRQKGYTCVFITGRDDMNMRMDNMERFNNKKGKPEILLLSLMAGGVGLNLVGANYVFFIEPHWNPQHELQAQDRVHRYGQTKDVFIRRYISDDTIESRIMDLQQQKRELADGLLSNTKKTRGPGITLDQIKTLFDMGGQRRPDDHV